MALAAGRGPATGLECTCVHSVPGCLWHTEDLAHERADGAGNYANAGALLHDRIIGALELCCRRGEMLLIQNKRVNWETCQIGIPAATAKDRENRRIPFNPKGRLAAILKRRSTLRAEAYVFGTVNSTYQPNIQTAWETLRRRRIAQICPRTITGASKTGCGARNQHYVQLWRPAA